MKKFIFTSLLVFLGIVICTPSFAAPSASPSPSPTSTASPVVILDQLLTGPVPALNAKDLNIPADLTPGYHELTVEVYNDKGVISSKTALFCKDLAGELHFDNVCPDLVPKPKPKKPAPFNPYSNPEETISFLAIAVGIASLLLGTNRGEGDTPPDLGSADANLLAARGAKPAWGDRRWYVNIRANTSLDNLPKSMAKVFDRFSLLLARTATDARYLRAIFGNLAWLTIPATLYFSYIGMRSIKNHAIPFDRNITLILMLIGIFDAFAGLCAAFVYLDFVFASGNLGSQPNLFFALGFSLLFFAPGLLASKFRPMHRSIEHFESFWERLSDYVLGTLLTGWAAAKLVGALNGLIGYELPITKHANVFGLFIGLALLVRLLLEEIAWYGYPHRIEKLSVQLKPRGIVQRIRAILFKLLILVVLAEPYIGWNRYLAAGVAIFLIPQLLGFIDHKLPNWKALAQITPRGVFKLVLLGIIGLIVGSRITNAQLSAKETVLISFVIMPIPGFIYSVFDSFSGSPFLDIKHPKFRYLYRLFGIVVLIILILQVLGLNPIVEANKSWQNPGATFHSLTYTWWPNVQTGCHNFSHWMQVAWEHVSTWAQSAWHHTYKWVVNLFSKNGSQAA